MVANLKRNFALIIAMAFALSACGQGPDSAGSFVAIPEGANPEISASPEGENDCSEKAPLDESPMSYCKALSDGTVHAVTLKPSRYVQDAETCVITVVDDGMKLTVLEMGFEPCEV